MKNLLTKTLFISLLLSAAIPSGIQAAVREVGTAVFKKAAVLYKEVVETVRKAGTAVASEKEVTEAADEAERADKTVVLYKEAAEKVREVGTAVSEGIVAGYKEVAEAVGKGVTAGYKEAVANYKEVAEVAVACKEVAEVVYKEVREAAAVYEEAAEVAEATCEAYQTYKGLGTAEDEPGEDEVAETETAPEASVAIADF